MAIRPTGVLGGRNASHPERRAAVVKRLTGKPVIDFGYRHQCVCGGTLRSLWRRRWVCIRCGRWFHDTTVGRRMADIGGTDPRDGKPVTAATNPLDAPWLNALSEHTQQRKEQP